MKIPIKKIDETFHIDLTKIWNEIKFISEEIDEEKKKEI